MAGADSGTNPGTGPGWRWDVALSFAAAQRDYVEQVARALQARGVRCFYDADEQIDLWGKYLAEELPVIYAERAAAVVVFVSADYAARDWTRLERRAALNRAVRERGEYVLPARFDDTALPGLLSDIVAVDLSGRTPKQFAAMLAAKLAALGIVAARPGDTQEPAWEVEARPGEATGEELGITPPLTSAQIARNRRRKIMSGRMLAGVVAAATIAAAALTTGLLLASHPETAQKASVASNSLSAAALRHAESATVRLLIGSQASYTGWGSGTLISSDGLILTNAHVAEPEAPGAAVAAGLPASQLGPDPPFLTVELTAGQSSAAVARFRARPVAVDGYLDLAVIRIYATSSGQPVTPASLHLPYLTLGNVGSLQLDQPLTVLGFPGVSGSSSITVTSGVISTFVPDPLKHVTDPRFELETSARVAHGNSGGAAIDNSGRLIGVPSLAIPGEGSDVSWRLRSVAEAKPLLAAARNSTPYRSTLLVQLTGSEQSGPAGVGTTAAQACAGSPVVTAAAAPSVMFGVRYTGFPQGLDIAMLIRLPDGTALTSQLGGLPQSTASASSGCFSYNLSASQLGLASVPYGTYGVQLLAGPDLAPVSAPTNVSVESQASAPPS